MTILYSLIVGALVGMLINYLADVLPKYRHLTLPVCWNCDQPYKLKDYWRLSQCSNCGKRRSIRSFIVLLASMVACMLLQYYPFYLLGFWETLPLVLFLGAVLVIDIEHRLVLIETTLFGLVLGLIYGIIMHGIGMTLWGGLAGFLIMLALYLFGIGFSKLMGKLRHKEVSEVAFGFGDVCAGTFLGFLAGWPAILGAIMIAMLVFGAFALVLIVVLIISHRYRAFASAQPFVPFLILGVVVFFFL